MTFYYRTTTTSSGNQQVSEETKAFWQHASDKKNWRIVQLPNGYFQTELQWENSWNDVTRRETVEGAEAAIDTSVEHYKNKLEFVKGPKVVKTFE
jgi:hypothetical protein